MLNDSSKTRLGEYRPLIERKAKQTEDDVGYEGWKHLIPCRSSPKNPKTLPLVTAGPLSFLTLHWLNGYIYRAYKYGVNENDLYDTHLKDSAEYNCDLFESYWKDEVAQRGVKKASVPRTIVRMMRGRFICAIILDLIMNAVPLLRSAYFLRMLFVLMEAPSSSYSMQILLLVAICLSSVIHSLTFAGQYNCGAVAGARVRSGMLSLVFKKVLFQRSQNASVGKLVNLCANDGQRLYDAIQHGPFLFSVLPVIGATVYAGYLLGPWGIFGFVIFFAFIPFQILLSRLVFLYRQKAVPITEERVKLMSEIITAMKLVKMYAWEKPFAKKIGEIRVKETQVLEKSLRVQSILSAQAAAVPIISAVFTFLAMTLTNQDITVTQAFVFISLLNRLRVPLGILPYCLKYIAEGYSACKRIKKLLITEDESTTLSELSDQRNLVEIRNGYFGWRVHLQRTTESDKQTGPINTEVITNKQDMADKKNGGYMYNEDEKDLLLESESSEDSMESSSGNTIITLHGITLSLAKGELLGICGAVGSGKTSIIQAILGMMRKENGEMALNKDMNIAYVPQQAWIMNATARDNILFGKEFDAEKYWKIVEACALLSDFKQLPAGDQTEIGERGINLSGGQKQRISLARAVYSDADLFLLDDPLSAVDAHVGQHLFTHCLKDMLKDKTVLFVTHQLQFLTDCDYILVMKDGQIIEEGTHNCLMGYIDGEYSNLIKTFHNNTKEKADCKNDRENKKQTMQDGDAEKHASKEKNAKVSNKENDDERAPSMQKTSTAFDSIDSSPSSLGSKLTTKENISEDKVRLSTVTSYVKAAGGAGITSLVVFLLVLYSALQSFENYWISYWIEDGSGGVYINQTIMINNTQYVTLTLSERIVDNPRLSFYQIVYAVALILLLIVAYLTAHSYMAFCTCASTKIHDNIFRRTIASPMRFFDVTPSGQILNRFSKDMDEVDANFPFQSDLFFKNVSVILVGLVLILLASPWFLLTLIPIVGLVISLGRFSTAAIRQSKRIENVTKSPLFSHIAASVQGLSTIKAYKKENDFIERFHKLQDRNNMALLMHDSSTRWLSVRIDSVSLLIIISTFLLVTLVPLEGTTSAMAALALTYALSISDVAHYTLRLGIETDARLISAERIQNYVKNLESEAPAVIEHSRPEKAWPKYGAIKFYNVNVRYREGLPLVLKNISLDIKPQEKIGIVGRTGSGKSSLALTLFRIMELDCGSITIDGVNISTIGLEDLRSKLSIIPQDPVLFMGTVRYNIDPFNKYKDEMLWSALQSCHIKHTIKSLDGQLDAVVTENGENFSVGERQLLCMARALLRCSKILVLDEATAAIDTEKDSLIQETITEVFADCTMLTIAHRLNTVVSYDRILVLDNGEVMEFDSPENLLADRTSEFSKMMAAQESQKQNARHRENI